MKKSSCLICETEIDEHIMYCENCYTELCNERKNQVVQYVKQGMSFDDACEVVVNEHEIETEDIEFLFIT